NQHELHLPDFFGTEIDKVGATADNGSAAPGAIHGDHGDDATAAVDNDDLIANNEILVVTEFRTNVDDRRGHRNNSDARWYNRANRHAEVHVVDARNVRPGKHGLPDTLPLLDAEVDPA